jgi:hypothetical protein
MDRRHPTSTLGKLFAPGFPPAPLSALYDVRLAALVWSLMDYFLVEDAGEHICINLRLPTHGGVYIWEFRKGGRELKVRVQGRAVLTRLR